MRDFFDNVLAKGGIGLLRKIQKGRFYLWLGLMMMMMVVEEEDDETWAVLQESSGLGGLMEKKKMEMGIEDTLVLGSCAPWPRSRPYHRGRWNSEKIF